MNITFEGNASEDWFVHVRHLSTKSYRLSLKKYFTIFLAYTAVFPASLLSFLLHFCLPCFNATFLASLLPSLFHCCLPCLTVVFLASLLSFSLHFCLLCFTFVFLASNVSSLLQVCRPCFSFAFLVPYLLPSQPSLPSLPSMLSLLQCCFPSQFFCHIAVFLVHCCLLSYAFLTKRTIVLYCFKYYVRIIFVNLECKVGK